MLDVDTIGKAVDAVFYADDWALLGFGPTRAYVLLSEGGVPVVGEIAEIDGMLHRMGVYDATPSNLGYVRAACNLDLSDAWPAAGLDRFEVGREADFATVRDSWEPQAGVAWFKREGRTLSDIAHYGECLASYGCEFPSADGSALASFPASSACELFAESERAVAVWTQGRLLVLVKDGAAGRIRDAFWIPDTRRNRALASLVVEGGGVGLPAEGLADGTAAARALRVLFGALRPS